MLELELIGCSSIFLKDPYAFLARGLMGRSWGSILILWFYLIELKSTDILELLLIVSVYWDLMGLSSRLFGMVSWEFILRTLVYRFELFCGCGWYLSKGLAGSLLLLGSSYPLS